MSQRTAGNRPWPEWLSVSDLFSMVDAIEAGKTYAEECLFRHKQEMGVERPLCEKLAGSISDDIGALEDAHTLVYELILELKKLREEETEEEGRE